MKTVAMALMIASIQGGGSATIVPLEQCKQAEVMIEKRMKEMETCSGGEMTQEDREAGVLSNGTCMRVVNPGDLSRITCLPLEH